MIDELTPIEKLTTIEPPRPPEGEQGRAVGSYGISPSWRPLKFIIAAAFVLIAFVAVIPGWIQKWLWMRQLGYVGVFWTIWSVRWELFAAAFVVALLYLGINLRFAQRNGAAFSGGKLRSPSTVAAELGIQVSPRALKLATAAIAAVAGLSFAAIFYTQWDTYLRFRYGGSFGLSDPLFGVDTGFYLFRLPFYELLQGSLTALAFITLLAVIGFYAYFGLLRLRRNRQTEDRSAKAIPHLSMLAFCSGGRLGMGILPRPLRTPLLHARSCLRSRLYGRSCDAGRLLAYGRRRGGAVCVARPECLPASLQGGTDRSRSLRGVVHLAQSCSSRHSFNGSRCSRTSWPLKPHISKTTSNSPARRTVSTRSRKHPIRRWRI